MAITFQGLNTDVFGGPAGQNSEALKLLMDGIMKRQQNQKQRNQSSLVSSMFGESADEEDPMAFINSILTNPSLDQNSKQQALAMAAQRIAAQQAASSMESNKSGMAVDQSNIDLNRERIRASQNPAAKEEKMWPIEYWNPDGSPGGKKLVPDSKYNATIQSLQKSGYVVQKPDKPVEAPKGEFERLLETLDKSGKIKQSAKDNLINKRISKLVESGGDKDETNKVELGDGTKVTLAELRGQYKVKYNIPDEFELQMMSMSPDPRVQSQAMKLKAEAATKPSFAEFLKDARENGLEGIRTEKEIKPPAGFILD
jgi:hypothetical protein